MSIVLSFVAKFKNEGVKYVQPSIDSYVSLYIVMYIYIEREIDSYVW